MNSKEALDKLNKHFHLDCYSFNDNENSKIREYEIIKQDLDRLEQIEKERQEVETRLSSKETNTFDEIATMIKKANSYDVLVDKCEQLEIALAILKDVVSLNCDKTLETERQFLRLSQEEYELLKEVLDCE